jgi:molybdopterin molybdotransferase
VIAGCPLPAFDNSAVDGYAVASADVADAGPQVVRDDVPELLRVIERAAPDIDVILTSGGISMRAYEVVKEALASRGIDFTQVAMQPGRPQGVGLLRGVPVVALPGNPVSALTSFEVFVRPALRAAMGLRPPERQTVELAPDVTRLHAGTCCPVWCLD